MPWKGEGLGAGRAPGTRSPWRPPCVRRAKEEWKRRDSAFWSRDSKFLATTARPPGVETRERRRRLPNGGCQFLETLAMCASNAARGEIIRQVANRTTTLATCPARPEPRPPGREPRAPADRLETGPTQKTQPGRLCHMSTAGTEVGRFGARRSLALPSRRSLALPSRAGRGMRMRVAVYSRRSGCGWPGSPGLADVAAVGGGVARSAGAGGWQ